MKHTNPNPGNTLKQNTNPEAAQGQSQRCGLPRPKRATPLRPSVYHLVLRGVDVPSVKELLGHADIRTTEIYVRLARAMRGEITGPLDDL